MLALHDAVPFAAVHALPQKPQLPTELVRSVSQFTESFGLHSPKPAEQGDGLH
jgi:hypothetical protein